MAAGKRAVKRFNTMIPSLRAYARQASGNPDLKLVAGARSETDGDTITLAPPVALGHSKGHNGQCNVREFGLLICPECAANEYVMAVLRHEIGHIVHGSFDCFSKGRVGNTLMDTNLHKIERRYTKRIYDSVYSSTTDPNWNKKVMDGGVPLIGHVNQARHPWLSMMFLIGEDMRCDEQRLRLDPDEREIFYSISDDFMVNGIERADGEVTYYIDMEVDMQMGMAFIFAARGSKIDGYFNDEVVELLDDDEARELMDEGLNAADTEATLEFVLKTLTWFNSKGYMKVDGKSEEELEKLIEAIEKVVSQIFGHGLDAHSKGHGGGMGGGASQDGAEIPEGLKPEDVIEVMKAFQLLDRVPENVGVPRIIEAGSGDAYQGYQVESEKTFKSNEKDLSPAVTAARLAFGVNARVEHHRNQKSGRIAGKMLSRRVPFGDERVFARRVTPDKRSYHVVIGMDVSGSSSGETLRNEKRAVLAMGDVCHRLGISFEIWAHATDYEMHTADWTEYPELYQVKMPKEAWSKKTKDNLRSLNSTGANLDGHTMQFYRKRAELSGATDKIVMYYTDGAMPALNHDEELEVIRHEVAYCKKNNITLMAVGMGVDTPTKHGLDTAVVYDSSDYRKVVEHLGKRLMK